MDWRRLYEDIVSTAKNKLEQLQGIPVHVAVPPETFDFLESGQLRIPMPVATVLVTGMPVPVLPHRRIALNIS